MAVRHTSRVLALPTRPGVLVLWFVLAVVAPLSAQGDARVLSPDHLGCVVDDATLAAVAESEFLSQQFAHTRSGGARPPRANHFIYGELTYVEFINPRLADPLGVAVGDCMIALNSDELGWLRELYDEVGELHPEWSPDFRLRDLLSGSDSLPWYYALDFHFESGIGGLGVWFMEYHPEFKHRMAPGSSEPGDISRQRSAPEVAFHPDKYFRDVTGVTVAVPPERRTQLQEQLSLAGFVEQPDPDTPRWSSDEFEVVIVPARESNDYAIREIRLGLTRAFEGAVRTFDLGSVRLELPTETSAVLRFDRPSR